jgi:hypothetical protein
VNRVKSPPQNRYFPHISQKSGLIQTSRKFYVFTLVSKPDGQGRTVRPQASFSLKARAFLSDPEAPPLSSLLFQRARKYIENQDAPEIYAGPIAHKEDSHPERSRGVDSGYGGL